MIKLLRVVSIALVLNTVRVLCFTHFNHIHSFHRNIMTTPMFLTLDELLENVIETKVDLKKPSQLKNTYYGLRHGESEANKLGIISSDPSVGTKIHGLTPLGRYQARKSATAVLENIGRDVSIKDLVFVSSDFTRAKQTAQECIVAIKNILQFESSVLGDNNCNNLNDGTIDLLIHESLRERYFGELDAKPLITYNYVWPVDQVDASNTRRSVESINAVVKRINNFINEFEDKYENKHIVLTSHADTLQIAQTFLAGADCRLFSQYRFKNGEVRVMSNLPTASPLIYKSPI